MIILFAAEHFPGYTPPLLAACRTPFHILDWLFRRFHDLLRFTEFRFRHEIARSFLWWFSWNGLLSMHWLIISFRKPGFSFSHFFSFSPVIDFGHGRFGICHYFALASLHFTGLISRLHINIAFNFDYFFDLCFDAFNLRIFRRSRSIMQ